MSMRMSVVMYMQRQECFNLSCNAVLSIYRHCDADGVGGGDIGDDVERIFGKDDACVRRGGCASLR